MTRTVDDTIKLYGFYRKFRQHQRDLQVADSGSLTVYQSGRTERSYGSAPYGEHALCAWSSARHHMHFLSCNQPVSRRRAAKAGSR